MPGTRKKTWTLVASALALLTGGVTVPRAHAQAPEAAQPAAALTPPRVAKFVEARRPEGTPAEGAAVDLELTFTAMGCPATDFIEDDIRERLLEEPDVDEVRIEVVWDPVWTRSRIREEARATMRRLGIVA